MSFNSSSNGKPPGSPTERVASALTQAEAALLLEQKIQAAIDKEREARVKAFNGDDRHVRPLPAGPQAYVDPKIWRVRDRVRFRKMLNLISTLDAARRQP